MGNVISIDAAKQAEKKATVMDDDSTSNDIASSPMGGWVKIHRSLKDHAIITNPYVCQLFLFCMLTASHKSFEAIVGASVVKLKAGELITGRKKLAKSLELNENQVRTALTILEKLEIVTIKKTSKYSVISIVNWDKFQQDHHQTTIKPPSNHQQSTTYKKVKNIKNNSMSDPAFSYVWDFYPKERRTKKTECLKKFSALCEKLNQEQVNELTNTIADDIEKRIANCEDTKYFPLSITYFNQKRWEDGL